MAVKKRMAKTPTTTKINGASSQELASPAPHKQSFTLESWLSHVSDHAKLMAAGGAPVGACLIADSQSGNNCVLTDQATCTKMGGTWLGGPCGSD